MKRHLQLRQPFTIQRYDARSWAVVLPVTASDFVPLLCELSLLLFGRSDQLTLLFENGRKLRVSVVDSSSTIGGSEHPVSITLSRNDLEVLVCFLLTWYRDGVAEVSHIDIDLTDSSSSGGDCTLVIKAENSRPPLPGDEAERILRNMP